MKTKTLQRIEVIGIVISLLFNLLPFIIPDKITQFNAFIISCVGIILVEIITIRFMQFVPSEQLIKLSEFFDLFEFKVNLDEIDLTESVVYKLCKEFTSDFKDKMDQLIKKEVVAKDEDISDLCRDMVKNLKHDALATVVVSETLEDWETQKGKEYLRECVSAAKRIDGKFTRIFIIEDNYEVSPSLYKLLTQQKNGGINTLIAYKKDLEEHKVEELDFGIWDNKILVTVHKSPITKRNTITYFLDKEYVERKSKEIMLNLQKPNLCKNFDGFLLDLKRPINVSWERVLIDESKIIPPIAPSKEELDLYKKIVQRYCNNGKIKKCLILGQTPQLIELMAGLGYEIDMIDCALSHSRLSKYEITCNPVNWLDFQGKTKYDVIIGDLVTNNLAIWQYYIFFENMAKNIAPDGALILRIMGKFFDPTKDMDIRFNSTILSLEDYLIKNRISEIDLRILMLHILKFFHKHCYDPKKKSFNTKEWNKNLEDYISKNKKDNIDYSMLMHNYDFEITSLSSEELKGYYNDFFENVACEPCDTKDYAELYNNFYRIFCWKKRNINNR